jgi:hypothetical protein
LLNNFHAFFIAINGTCEKTQIVGNDFYSQNATWTGAIVMNLGTVSGGLETVNIIGNTISDADNGIRVGQTTGHGVNILGNFFRNINESAIWLRGDDHIVNGNYFQDISKNPSTSTGQSGIVLTDGASRVKVTNNNIKNSHSNMIYGYTLTDTAGSSNIIENNTAPDATTAEVRLPSSVLTSGNSVRTETFMTVAGESNYTLSVARHSSSSGSALTVQAGGGSAGATNANGGTLTLSSGISTGNGGSSISFYTATDSLGSGTTDRSPSEKMRLTGSRRGRLVIGDDFTQSRDGITLSGNVVRDIWVSRNPTSNTAGSSLTIQSGGATSAATNKAAGDLILETGVSTGTGTSQILFKTADVGSSGTSDNALTTRATLTSTGLALAVPLTLTTQLAVAQGGTGATTLAGVLKGNGTSAVTGSASLTDVAAPTADFSMSSHKLTDLADPTSNQDAATKAYVDAVAQGLDAKDSCRLATTANITLSGEQTIDGVAAVSGDRVLVKNQTTGSQNGIYIVNTGAWSRSADADTSPEVTSGLFTFITGGTANSNTGWVLTTTGAITLGTTSPSFSQFSAATSVTAGNGLTLTGTTLDIVGTTNRISVAADSIDISASYVGQSSITTLGTITAGTWNGTTIAVANGGTGATTLTGVLKGNGTSAITGSATLDDIGAPTGNFSMNSHKITNLATPTVGTDAATKAYVDSFAGSGGVLTAQGFVADGLTGSVTTAYGLDTSNMGDASLSATTLTHVNIANAAASSLTNQFGIDVGALTGGVSNNIGIRIATPTGATANYALQLSGTAGTPASGITFGTDTNLYRSAANTLKTDDALIVTGDITVTSGSITGITDLAIADGGTAASNKTAGFNNLSPLTTQGDLLYHDGSNNVRLVKGTAGQFLQMNSGATAPAWVRGRVVTELGSDVASTASTSFQNITGLSFTVTSGTKYRFYAMIVYTASAATIGLRVSLTAPATTLLAYNTHVPLSTTGSAANDWVNGQATTDAGTVSTSSPTTTGNVLVLEGYILPSASGTVQLRFAPETATASGIVIKAGSTLEVW